MLKFTSYLLVGHFKEFEGRLLQGVGRLLDVLSRFRVLVGQDFTDLCNLLLQLGALRGGGAKRNWFDWLSDSLVLTDLQPGGFSLFQCVASTLFFTNQSINQSRWLMRYLISWQLVFELLHLGLGVVHDALGHVHSLHAVLQRATSA